MHGAHGALESLHWLGTTVLLASIAIQILPTPDEIPSKVYLVLFNTVRRVANLKMSAAWQEQQVLSTKTTATVEQTVVGDRTPKEG